MDTTKYVAIGPGYWAVGMEAEDAIIRLLKMLGTIQPDKVHHVQVFRVSDDWDFDGHNVTGSKVERFDMMKISGKVQAKVKAAYGLVEDIWQEANLDE